MTTSAKMTDDEIKSMILTLLYDAGGEAMWSDVRAQLPCGTWRAGELMTSLHLSGLLFASHFEGRTCIGEPLTGCVAA